MTETVSAVKQRETLCLYDLARRLIKVEVDTDGDNDSDEIVTYAYELGGQRTLVSLPNSNDVTYSYDARGQMRTLTAWNNATTQYSYDAIGRHTLTQRANGLRSLYRYDAGGRLRLLRHVAGQRTFAQFAYEVDARGNRTQAFETQRHPGSGTTEYEYDNEAIHYLGTWTLAGESRQTTEPYASFRLAFAGNEAVTLSFGKGPDHGRFDIYIGGSLWETIDCYEPTVVKRNVVIPLQNDGPFVIEVINRPDHGPASTGNKLTFGSLSVDGEYTLQTIQYTYDSASRVLNADYYPGENTASTPARR